MSNPHVVLIGDSIFDNATYVPGGPAVIDHLNLALPTHWQATLVAHDGDVVANVFDQLKALPDSVSHLVVSIGGNDALTALDMMNAPATSVMSALGSLTTIRQNFQLAYAAMLRSVLSRNIRTAVCTIYDSVPGLPSELQTALCIFNDAIIREASLAGIPVIDLRIVCAEKGDYSEISPIEPSATGGKKIADAIIRWLQPF